MTAAGGDTGDVERLDELEFNYEDLWYIPLSAGSKIPKRKWGGYSQDFHEADEVYTHDEIVDHPWDRWGIVGIQTPDHFPEISLLIFDLDVYKSDAPDAEIEKTDVPANAPIVETASGGVHIITSVQSARGNGKESEFSVAPDIDWDVDIRGSYVSHHVVAPNAIPGVDTDYELQNDKRIHGYAEPGEIEDGLSYDGEPLVTHTGRDQQHTSDIDYELPDESPEDLPDCLGHLLVERVRDEHPNQFKVHTYAAMLGYALGYETDELMALFVEEYPYGGGVDQVKTREHLERLAPKMEDGALLPPAQSTLHEQQMLPRGVSCDCPIHTYATESDDEDIDAIAAIDVERLQALPPDDRRRYASKHGYEWPTTEQVRDRLVDTICDVMSGEIEAVVDAPTAAGKSHTIATEPWLDHGCDVTGDQPVVHLHATKNARHEAMEASRDADVTARELLGRADACPMARGDHDPDGQHDTITVDGVPVSRYIQVMCDDRGIPFSVVHQHIEQLTDRIPVCELDGECRTKTQWNEIPRDDDGTPGADVIHATHPFAKVPGLTMHTNLVFDERPDFTEDLSTDAVQRHVAAFLKAVDAPVKTWESFVTFAGYSPDNWDRLAAQGGCRDSELQDAINQTPDREWFFECEDAHSLAPGLTRALFRALSADPDDNGRRTGRVSHEPPRFDSNASGEAGWNRSWLTVVIDDDNRIQTVRNTPDFSLTRSVIGLDAHPSRTLWERNTTPDIAKIAILDDDERRLWRLFERGLSVVQVGDATRPLTSGEYFSPRQVEVLATRLRDEYGADFRTAITAGAVEDDLREILSAVGVDDPGTMHFGEEKSRNDFGSETVGLVNGCIDPGDDYVVNLLAEAGLDATPETDDDGNREHGRGFEGPDADAAADILASVREQHVAQATGRYARDPDDQSDHATVYVRTDAVPEGFADVHVPGVTWAATDAQQAVMETLEAEGRATAREIAEETGLSKKHVANTLSRLRADGTVDVFEGSGEFGADVWIDGDSSVAGSVEITNDHVWGVYTWSFAIESPPRSDDTGESGAAPSPGCAVEPDRPPPDGQLTLHASLGD